MAARPPLTHVLFNAGSVADDLGYVALADLGSVMGSSTYRIIGGHMVTALVARWQLGAELYRETGDTDLGVPPMVVRNEDVIGRLLERGYKRVEGNRFARPIVDVPITVGGAEGPPPINWNHRQYRRTKLTLDGPGEVSSSGRSNRGVKYHSARRGTLEQRVFDVSRTYAVGDLTFKVKCADQAGGLNGTVNYAVAVSLEVGVDLGVDVYELVRQQLAAHVRV
jgi:hypothetical protein